MLTTPLPDLPSPGLRRLAGFALFLAVALVQAGQAQPRSSLRDWELSCRSREEADRDREQTCTIVERTLAAGSRLDVDGRMNGGIVVLGENRGDILVRAMIRANAPTRSRAEALAGEVRLHAENGRVFAEGPESRGREWWSVNYEVHVPSRLDLDLKAHNGGISVAAVTGMLRMETMNGGIHLDAVEGDVVAETTNGGLVVDLAGASWKGRGLDATTTNGGIRLRVPSDYSAHLVTGTVNGGVDIDFPVTVSGRIGKRISTDLGRGGAPLRLMTANGGVTIVRQ